MQRGNRKNNVFLDDSDRLVYLRLLRDASGLYRTAVWTYTLMDNHVHIIGVPETKDSLSKTIKEAHGEYSIYFNTKYGLVGHAWQGRFKSVPMDEDHCRNAVRYVELNPVRARIVRIAEEYLWSGAAAHCGLRDDSMLSSEFPLLHEIKNWTEWLRTANPKEFDDRIRLHTRTGRPLGSDNFLRKVESMTGRKVLPQRRGPKQKIRSNQEEVNKVQDDAPGLFG